MDSDKPATDAAKPSPRWAARRVCVVLFLLFGVILGASWWLTPIEPYASLILEENCAVFLFSPDGTMLVTAGQPVFGRSNGPLRIWDVEQGRERYSLAHDWKSIETVLFSPDSALLAAHDATSGHLRLWNTKTGEKITKLEIEPSAWADFRFSPDGRFLVFRDNRKGGDYITFWNIETQQDQGSVQSDFHTLAFAPDGKWFATSRRNQDNLVKEVLLWQLEQTPVLVKQHQIIASFIEFSPDLMTFATSVPDGNGQVVICEMLTGEKRCFVTCTHLRLLFFIANFKVLCAHEDRAFNWRVTLWDVASKPREIGSFSERPAISADEKWLATPLDSGAKLVRISAPEREDDLIVNGDLGPKGRDEYSPMPHFSPDSKMILVTRLHRLGRKPFLEKWLPEKYNPFRAGPEISVVRVWDIESRQEALACYNCSEAWFSPDGLVLMTLRDRHVLDLWQVPLRVSLGRIFAWAFIVWLIVLSICWLSVNIRKRLLSRMHIF